MTLNENVFYKFNDLDFLLLAGKMVCMFFHTVNIPLPLSENWDSNTTYAVNGLQDRYAVHNGVKVLLTLQWIFTTP